MEGGRGEGEGREGGVAVPGGRDKGSPHKQTQSGSGSSDTSLRRQRHPDTVYNNYLPLF